MEMHQGPTKKISAYIGRFNTIIILFVGNHLTN